MHDVCIVGAGPAGLNAALVLGRCGREVVVFDSGQPRNAASRGLHCYLSRDGIHPMELRTLGREEVRHYPTVTFIDSQIAPLSAATTTSTSLPSTAWRSRHASSCWQPGALTFSRISRASVPIWAKASTTVRIATAGSIGRDASWRTAPDQEPSISRSRC